jgi:hypothetical protein
MIASKYKSLFFSFLMAFLMSGIMSLVLSILAHSGPIQNLLWHWLPDWHLSFWVAFTATVLITPIVKKITAFMVKQEKTLRVYHSDVSYNSNEKGIHD